MNQQRDRDEIIWKPQLRLTRWHWNHVEDLADALRRLGARYRPGPSPIVAGILDAALPPIAAELERPEFIEQDNPKLAEVVTKHLVTLTIGEASAAARIAVAEYVRGVLFREALERADSIIRGQQRARSRRRRSK